MKLLIQMILIIIFCSNCSLNRNSNFWTEDVKKRVVKENKLKEILKKSEELMSLSFNEYKIFIEEYGKKSNYPKIN
tara:strand:+ start:59 stop:286 length:228 start_codon:yes stop_codon:yes gene_type:complete